MCRASDDAMSYTNIDADVCRHRIRIGISIRYGRERNEVIREA